MFTVYGVLELSGRGPAWNGRVLGLAVVGVVRKVWVCWRMWWVMFGLFCDLSGRGRRREWVGVLDGGPRQECGMVSN